MEIVIDSVKYSGYHNPISGTTRSQDLLPELIKLANIVQPHISHTESIPDGVFDDDDHPWWDDVECECLMNDTLFDVLSDNAPKGYYFGASNNDLLGFWKLPLDT